MTLWTVLPKLPEKKDPKPYVAKALHNALTCYASELEHPVRVPAKTGFYFLGDLHTVEIDGTTNPLDTVGKTKKQQPAISIRGLQLFLEGQSLVHKLDSLHGSQRTKPLKRLDGICEQIYNETHNKGEQ